MADFLRRDFDEFLFAAVTVDANGNPLTVVTALARHDLDPWEEAASLARMSPDSAAQRLAAHFADVPNGPPTQDDRLAVATRLVSLLRRAPAPIARSADAGTTVVLTTRGRRLRPAVYLLLALTLLLIGQWVAAVRQPQFPVNTSQPSAPRGS